MQEIIIPHDVVRIYFEEDGTTIQCTSTTIKRILADHFNSAVAGESVTVTITKENHNK